MSAIHTVMSALVAAPEQAPRSGLDTDTSEIPFLPGALCCDSESGAEPGFARLLGMQHLLVAQHLSMPSDVPQMFPELNIALADPTPAPTRVSEAGVPLPGSESASHLGLEVQDLPLGGDSLPLATTLSPPWQGEASSPAQHQADSATQPEHWPSGAADPASEHEFLASFTTSGDSTLIAAADKRPAAFGGQSVLQTPAMDSSVQLQTADQAHGHVPLAGAGTQAESAAADNPWLLGATLQASHQAGGASTAGYRLSTPDPVGEAKAERVALVRPGWPENSWRGANTPLLVAPLAENGEQPITQVPQPGRLQLFAEQFGTSVYGSTAAGAAVEHAPLVPDTVSSQTLRMDSARFTALEVTAVSRAPGAEPGAQSQMLHRSFGHAQWGDSISQRIALMVGQGLHAAQIRLDPPELGELLVRIQISGEQASVSFVSQHAIVREALEQTTGRLQEMLAEEGVELLDVNVSDEQGGRQNAEDDTAPAVAESDSSEQVDVLEPSRTLGLVDYYA